MTTQAKKIMATLLLALLALPTGLCSLVFTPMAFGSFFGRNAFEQGIGTFALICSGTGWVICGLTIWGALRLRRVAREAPPMPSP